MRRLVCWIQGHDWGGWEYGGTGDFTGFLEVRHCRRCPRILVVQVPQ